MTDKIPTYIFAGFDGLKVPQKDASFKDDGILYQYTLKHNNPDYYVIPKSDVQALTCHPDERVSVPYLEWEALKKALIEQSDTVTIPRDILELEKIASKVIGFYNFGGLRGTPDALVALGDMALLLDKLQKGR